MKCISIVALGTWGDFSPLLSAAAELARDADTAVQVITHFQHLERLLNECGPNIILSPDNKRMHCIEHGVSPALRLRIDHLLSSMRQFQIQIPNAVTTHIAVRLIGVDLPIYMKPAEEVLRLEQAIVETKLCESLCQSNGSDPKLIVFSPYSMHVLHAADLLGPAYIPILISPGWFDDLLKQYALDLDSPQMPGLIRSCQSNASPRWTVHDFERGWMLPWFSKFHFKIRCQLGLPFPFLDRIRDLTIPCFVALSKHLTGECTESDSVKFISIDDIPFLKQQLDPEIESFLAAHSHCPPMFVTFGSMELDPETLRQLQELFETLAVEMKCPMILQLQCSDERKPKFRKTNDSNDSNVLRLEKSAHVPHPSIFSRCSLIVHHGGAGTTRTAALHAVPQLVLPMAFDQFFWAQRVRDLGLGDFLHFSHVINGMQKSGNRVETLSMIRNALHTALSLSGAATLTDTADELKNEYLSTLKLGEAIRQHWELLTKIRSVTE